MIINAENSNNMGFNFLININDRKIKCCPHCKSTLFIKHGKSNGKQRYLCNNCKITFSTTTNTTLYHSRKPFKLWSEFLVLLLSNTSLRDSSTKLQINLKTAFTWRHKLLNCLTSITKTTKLKDCIEMRKIFIRENNKGQRGKLENTGKKVWVIVSSDSNDDTFAEPISLGCFRKNNFTKLVYSKIHVNSYIKTFGDNYIKGIANKHNQNKIEKSNYSSKELVYTFSKNIKGIISKCRGVATKYLPHYFSLAKIISLNRKYSHSQLLDIFSYSYSYITVEQVKAMIPVYQSIFYSKVKI